MTDRDGHGLGDCSLAPRGASDGQEPPVEAEQVPCCPGCAAKVGEQRGRGGSEPVAEVGGHRIFTRRTAVAVRVGGVQEDDAAASGQQSVTGVAIADRPVFGSVVNAQGGEELGCQYLVKGRSNGGFAEGAAGQPCRQAGVEASQWTKARDGDGGNGPATLPNALEDGRLGGERLSGEWQLEQGLARRTSEEVAEGAAALPAFEDVDGAPQGSAEGSVELGWEARECSCAMNAEHGGRMVANMTVLCAHARNVPSSGGSPRATGRAVRWMHLDTGGNAMADQWRCDQCNQDFQSQDQYERHNQGEHQGGQQGGFGQQASQGGPGFEANYSGNQGQQGGGQYRQ